ncbi:hypothetical protein BDQ12DRAFT_674015 [Crucibulum laeve]|uniref:Uncharacterized protein n=1 Tax=Crucibulum laeve TaxID=68775 RepID=A0A5C3MIM4_9AGAR|nr:hypothetical protein BDQ12DRAFT_674015 [Crucibulum laeve]
MLPVLDILHRGVVYSLVGISIWGVGMSVAVHRDTLRRGREIMAQREASASQQQLDEQHELELAAKAQSAIRGRDY